MNTVLLNLHYNYISIFSLLGKYRYPYLMQLVCIFVLLAAVCFLFFVYLPRQSCSRTEMESVLPTIPANFIGRESEIKNMTNLIIKQHIKIIVITGGPGIGKSSVSIMVGHRLAETMQVIFVSLTNVDSIEGVWLGVATAIGGFSGDPASYVCSWLSKRRDLLVLILDNADHFTLGTDASLRDNFHRQIIEMSAWSHNVHIIITTQYQLSFTDFEIIRLSSLNLTETTSILCAILSSQHCESASHSKFAEFAGGIPLAAKIIGSLLKHQNSRTEDILNQLSQNSVRTLSKEQFGTERISHCFNVSVAYLSPIMKTSLIIASKFHGSFDKAANNAIVAKLVNTECMEHLVSRSLIEYDGRYSMHNLLREFSQQSINASFDFRHFVSLYADHYINLLSEENNMTSWRIVVNQESSHLTYVFIQYDAGNLPSKTMQLLHLLANYFNGLRVILPDVYFVSSAIKTLNFTCAKGLVCDHSEAFKSITYQLGKHLLATDQVQLAESVLSLGLECMARCSDITEASLIPIERVLLHVYEAKDDRKKVLEKSVFISNLLQKIDHSLTILKFYLGSDYCNLGAKLFRIIAKDDFGKLLRFLRLSEECDLDIIKEEIILSLLDTLQSNVVGGVMNSDFIKSYIKDLEHQSETNRKVMFPLPPKIHVALNIANLFALFGKYNKTLLSYEIRWLKFVLTLCNNEKLGYYDYNIFIAFIHFRLAWLYDEQKRYCTSFHHAYLAYDSIRLQKQSYQDVAFFMFLNLEQLYQSNYNCNYSMLFDISKECEEFISESNNLFRFEASVLLIKYSHWFPFVNPFSMILTFWKNSILEYAVLSIQTILNQPAPETTVYSVSHPVSNDFNLWPSIDHRGWIKKTFSGSLKFKLICFYIIFTFITLSIFKIPVLLWENGLQFIYSFVIYIPYYLYHMKLLTINMINKYHWFYTRILQNELVKITFTYLFIFFLIFQSIHWLILFIFYVMPLPMKDNRYCYIRFT